MSYSSDLKRQLVEKEVKKSCCRRAAVYGLLAIRGVATGDDITLSLEGESVAPFAAAEIGRLFGTEVRVGRATARSPRATVAFSSPEAAAYLRAAELTYPRRSQPCPHCQSHFLRGIFLAAGRMSDYTKLYRLEFSAKDRTDALAALLSELDLPPKRTERRGEVLLYYKTNAAICDVLAAIGAEAAAFSLINDTIEAGYRNAANRRANCEARNIERAVDASMRFVHIYRRLEEADKLSRLPEDLRATARLRAENPMMSLAALGARHTPPISKSGMNHRLEKIEQMIKEILKNKEE